MMKIVRPFLFFGALLFVAVHMSQCASSPKLQDSIPLDLGEPYYQSWIAGIKGGGSGFDVYIPIKNNPNHIILDSVYFRDRGTKLEEIQPGLFRGRLDSSLNKSDIIMSNAPYAEYGNTLPKHPKPLPFELKDNECILGYREHHRKKYFKISGVIKKEPLYYPGTPPKKP
ncbi:hypothetical protein [Aestuariivivens sediminis]|uniref:hypothetical protein n=1 Tax=Aestuariivivens sediminis TaxID=2913557 RepID=UPI001F5728D8|nr:hypothetical protein [Aestuariivivens sediminis]